MTELNLFNLQKIVNLKVVNLKRGDEGRICLSSHKGNEGDIIVNFTKLNNETKNENIYLRDFLKNMSKEALADYTIIE